MKVLIISLARTGSSNLQKSIAKKYNLKLISEPYNIKGYIGPEFSLDEDNIIIKTIFWHIPKNINNIMEWYVNISKKFDEVILLSRKNLKECAESHAYLRYQKEKYGFSSTSEYFWEKTPNYDEIYNLVFDSNIKLIELSQLINVEITYYEDIYSNSKSGKLRLGNKEDIEKKLI